MSDIQMPDLLRVQIPDRPQIRELPDYNPELARFEGRMPEDIQAEWWPNFYKMRNEQVAALDEATRQFVQQYFPRNEGVNEAGDRHIQDYLEGRTTALPSHYQDLIFQRLRAQVDAQSLRVTREAQETNRRRGMGYPPGALLSAVAQAQAQAARNVGDASLGAASRTAELEQQFLQFALGAAQAMRTAALAAHDQHWRQLMAVNTLAANAADSIANLALSAVDRWVALFQAELRRGELAIRVWETQVRHVLIDLEVHNAILQAERLRSQLNQDEIALVNARIALDERFLRRYEAELSGIRTKLDVERTKVQLFASEVDAYQGYVSGRRVETEIYRALMDGDQAKLNGELAKLRGAEGQLNLATAKIAAIGELNRSRGDYNAETRAQWKTLVDKVIADYGIDRAAQEGDIASARLALASNDQKLREAIQTFEAESGQEQAVLGAEVERAKLELTQIVERMKSHQREVEAIAQINKEAAAVSGDMAASMVAGLTTLIQASYIETTEG